MTTLSVHQEITLRRVSALLDERRNRSNEQTFQELDKLGLRVYWKRVTWTGGVGSFKIMRSKRCRVLVSATKSGLSRSKSKLRTVGTSAFIVSKTSSKRTGFRYGWCIEIPP